MIPALLCSESGAPGPPVRCSRRQNGDRWGWWPPGSLLASPPTSPPATCVKSAAVSSPCSFFSASAEAVPAAATAIAPRDITFAAIPPPGTTTAAEKAHESMRLGESVAEESRRRTRWLLISLVGNHGSFTDRHDAPCRLQVIRALLWRRVLDLLRRRRCVLLPGQCRRRRHRLRPVERSLVVTRVASACSHWNGLRRKIKAAREESGESQRGWHWDGIRVGSFTTKNEQCRGGVVTVAEDWSRAAAAIDSVPKVRFLAQASRQPIHSVLVSAPSATAATATAEQEPRCPVSHQDEGRFQHDCRNRWAIAARAPRGTMS